MGRRVPVPAVGVEVECDGGEVGRECEYGCAWGINRGETDVE